MKKLSLFKFFIVLLATNLYSDTKDTAQVEITDFIKNKESEYKVPVEITKIVKGDVNSDTLEDVVINYAVNVGYPGNASENYIAVFLKKDNEKLHYITEVGAGFFGTAEGELLSL